MPSKSSGKRGVHEIARELRNLGQCPFFRELLLCQHGRSPSPSEPALMWGLESGQPLEYFKLALLHGASSGDFCCSAPKMLEPWELLSGSHNGSCFYDLQPRRGHTFAQVSGYKCEAYRGTFHMYTIGARRRCDSPEFQWKDKMVV